MQQFRVPVLGYRLLLALAGAAVALTAGFAGVTFVRLIGLVVLGPPAAEDGSGAAGSADDRQWDGGWLGRAGIAILSAGCLALTATLPLLIRALAAGLLPSVPALDQRGASVSVGLGPVFGGFSVLSPSWMWIVMPLLALADGLYPPCRGNPDDPGTASARLAVGNGGNRRRRLLYRGGIRQPHPAGTGRRPALPLGATPAGDSP